MTDFNKKLDETSSRIRENIQQQQKAAEAERLKQLASVQNRQHAVEKSYGLALQFMETCIKPIMEQFSTKIPGGRTHSLSDEGRGYVGQRLEFRETEYLLLKVHFSEQGIELSAEASCLGEEIVYSEKSMLFAKVQFDEKDAQDWIESHALEAYEAFGRHADAVRNPPSVVTYDPVHKDG